MTKKTIINRSGVWELMHNSHIVLADVLVKKMLSDGVYKEQFKVNIADNHNQILCSFCKTPVYFSSHSALGLYFKHRPAGKDESIKIPHQNCPFHTGDEKHPLLAQIYSGEGHWHFTTKHFIAGILQQDESCRTDSINVEKYIIDHVENTRRCPDIYFEDNKNRKWAVELTNHWMNPTIAVQRAKFFRSQDINVIWLLSPKCSINQDAMFSFTLFGLSGIPNDSSEMSSHFNGYTMDDGALASSKTTSKFMVKALLPSFSFSKTDSKIVYGIEEQLTHYFDLHTDTSSRVPYLEHKGDNYQQAKDELVKHLEDEHQRKIEYKRLEAEKKKHENKALIKANEQEMRREQEQRRIEKVAKAERFAVAKQGYDKFCDEIINEVPILTKKNFDNIPVIEAIDKSYAMSRYQDDKVSRIRSLNAKHGFFNEQVLLSLTDLRSHVEFLVNHHEARMNEAQQEIMKRLIYPIEVLSESFNYKQSYRDILLLALQKLKETHVDLHESYHQDYLVMVSHKIRAFALSVTKEVDKVIKDSLSQAPLLSEIYKLIGAEKLLSQTDFANLNSSYQQKVLMLRQLHGDLSRKTFT